MLFHPSLPPQLHLQQMLRLQSVPRVVGLSKYFSKVDLPDNVLVTRAFAVELALTSSFAAKPRSTGFSTRGAFFSMPSDGDVVLMFDVEGRNEGLLIQVRRRRGGGGFVWCDRG